ncbi:MAG: helix-hairpin-helix domain-containing protein [Flavobacteriales bacterium]|nr:helix-hairpin-helix domain-containing protein [Flavobacteriales bacterium]
MSRREVWKDWFYFTTRQRKGLLWLSALCIALVVTKYFLSHGSPSESADARVRFEELLAWRQQLENKVAADSAMRYERKRHEWNEDEQLFVFDPNRIDDSQWSRLGFSEGQVRSIRKFINAGGKFEVKSDLRKLYVVDESRYLRLAPFIDLPDSINRPVHIAHEPNAPREERTRILVELNSADTIQLDALPGIGPYFARSIFRYREKLGGYMAINQLLEVYRMRPGLLDSIRPFVSIDPAGIRKLEINRLDDVGMSTHPYLTKKQAAAIVAYRQKHGPFGNRQDLERVLVLTPTDLDRLVPYIDFN